MRVSSLCDTGVERGKDQKIKHGSERNRRVVVLPKLEGKRDPAMDTPPVLLSILILRQVQLLSDTCEWCPMPLAVYAGKIIDETQVGC